MEQFLKWNNFQIEQILNWTILNMNNSEIEQFFEI
jgi:hypothetical protein